MTRILTILLLLVPCLAYGQVVPGRYYSENIGDCFSEWVRDGTVLIEGTRYRFIEGSCELINATPVRDLNGATLYDGDCYAEGSEYEMRIMLMNTRDGGLVVVLPGYSQTYQRCPIGTD